MDNQQDDTSQIKTHEEIMRLFKDLEIVEAKVKNPYLFNHEWLEPAESSRTIELPFHKPEEPAGPQKQITPTTEILFDEEEKPKRPFWKKKQKPSQDDQKRKKLFFLFKEEIDTEPDLEVVNTVEESAPQVEIPRTTFVLQVDSEGNLVGLPLKKHKPKKEEETNAVSEEESVRGLKGKLKKIGSLFHRKGASDSESSGGISEKLKGLFHRKSKE